MIMIDIDRDKFNEQNASRKECREFIADALVAICIKHGATVERKNVPANPGYCGQGIDLRVECKGVGAMIDIDDTHGGKYALIAWFNTDHPPRNFTGNFEVCTCGPMGGNARPHHKATSQPANWYSLAMALDAGLLLAARGEAFEPSAT